MNLLFVRGKKWLNYYDDHGNWLGDDQRNNRLGDRPKGNLFRIETEDTADGMDVKVTLPTAARTTSSLDVKYFSTFW